MLRASHATSAILSGEVQLASGVADAHAGFAVTPPPFGGMLPVWSDDHLVLAAVPGPVPAGSSPVMPIADFLGLEALDRAPGSASNLNASRDDQGTTRMIAITYGLAAELPLALRNLPAPQLPPMAGPAGLMVQAAGLALRAWSTFV